MCPWYPGDYDFAAADNLYRTLNQGGDKLAAILANRGNWANQYLLWQQGGQQGWVGTEYNTWAGQFNESQWVLGKYVNQLRGTAVQVNNLSSDTEQQQGRPHVRGHLRTPDNQGWRKAPPNTGGHGVEGATPQFLYSYSDNATKANDENLRSFFAKNLTAASAAFQSSKWDLSSEGSGLARAIVWFLRWQLLELDARVRIVGEAFEAAGAGLKGDPAPKNQQYLTFTGSTKLDNTIAQTASTVQLANNLARQALKNGLTPDIWNQLKEHEKDPVFTATFLNDLAGPAIQFRNDRLGGEGLATGNTDSSPLWQMLNLTQTIPGSQDILTTMLVSGYASGEFSGPLEGLIYPYSPMILQSLAANPQASLNFMNSLNQEQIAELATAANLGNGTLGTPNASTDAESRDFMNVAASALKAMDDPAAMRTLMDKISVAYSGYTPANMDVMVPAIGNLLANFDSAYLADPPPGSDTVDWLREQGYWAGKYAQKFGYWVYSKDVSITNNATTARQMAENIAESAALALIPVPGGLLAAAAVAGIEQAATGYITPAADAALNPSTADPYIAANNFVHARKVAAEGIVAGRLFSEGDLMIKKPGGGLELLDPNSKNSGELLTWALDPKNQSSVVLKTNPNDTLAEVIDAVDKNYAP